jgi:hypothetical protein
LSLPASRLPSLHPHRLPYLRRGSLHRIAYQEQTA